MTAPVLLVGGGPGPADLLTLRAELALAAAGTVLADRALAAVAEAAAPRATLVLLDEHDAGAVVAQAAAARPPVVRLYVGDPWLHPAHAAELAALTAAGVATEPVPGVSVAVGVATAAGRPAHHRGHSMAARITGDRMEVVTGG